MAYNLKAEDYLVYEWKTFRKAMSRILDTHMRQMVNSAWKAFEDAYTATKADRDEDANPAYIVISADDPKAKEIIAILERED